MRLARKGGAALLAAGGLAAAAAVAAFAQTAPFEIPTTRVENAKEALAAQAADPKWKREATLPEDWEYTLADGVTTRQVSFYVDGGARLYGKLYLPNSFNPRGSQPAVVVGHGINAVSLGIEKYAARFAERGIPAMAIDYQSYGYSDSGADELMLLAPDPTIGTDAAATRVRLPVRIKRTNLNNVHEVAAFRAAISFLQGEPGIDPGRIGVWASSNGGTVVHQLITEDARVKAAVIHVMSTPPGAPRQNRMSDAQLADAIQRVRTGQGGEVTAGFSFATKIDAFGNVRNRDINGPGQFDRVRPTTAVLYLPAERDELVGDPSRGAVRAVEYFKERGVPAQVIVFPGLTHFQPYSGAGFDVGSNLAADWFIKHLGER